MLSYIYMARFYAAKTLDEDLFNSYLDKVNSFDLDKAPQIALLNQIAKKKAQLLEQQKAEIF